MAARTRWFESALGSSLSQFAKYPERVTACFAASERR